MAVTPDAADLETLFADLAKNISKPGATNIVIVDKVNPDFEIVSVGTPPAPTILTDCPEPEFSEDCRQPVRVKLEGCQDTAEYDLGDVYLESQGKILELDLTLKNICPGKRVALAVILTEVDSYGTEYPRGMKILTVPAHFRTGCQDISVRCIKFVLPDDLNVSCSARCCERNFKARVISHYIDSGFDCCGNVQVTV